MTTTIKPFVSPDPGHELVAIARDLGRLQPSWERPETFHLAKSELVGRLRRLAGVANGMAWPPESLGPIVRVRFIEREVIKVVVVKIRASLLWRRKHRYPRPPTAPGQGSLGS